MKKSLTSLVAISLLVLCVHAAQVRTSAQAAGELSSIPAVASKMGRDGRELTDLLTTMPQDTYMHGDILKLNQGHWGTFKGEVQKICQNRWEDVLPPIP